MLNPKALNLFHSVVESGSLAAACKRIHTSVPAASRLISQMESELGFSLFSRDGRRLELTSEGKRFSQQSRAALNQLQRLDSVAEKIRNYDQHHLSVVSTMPLISSWVVPVLGKLNALNPEFSSSLEVVDYNHLKNREGRERHDVILAPFPLEGDTDGVKTLELCSFPFVVCVQKDHPLARKSEVTANELADTPIVSLQRGFIAREIAEKYFHNEGVPFTPRIETSNTALAVCLAKQKLGVTIVPSLYLYSREDPDLVGIPIEPEQHITFGMCQSDEVPCNNTQYKFAELLIEQAQKWPGTKVLNNRS